MRVPVADLHAQHAVLQDELVEAFRRVVGSSAFINGAEVDAFEREFAAYCGVVHAVGVANGTDALLLALRAVGVGAGDAVALPAFTFAATAEAVYHAGAEPLLVDVDPHTLTLDPDALRQATQRWAAVHHRRVGAIIPVHLYGQPAAMDAIAGVATELGAAVIEDAAQAHGARYHGRRAGALGVCGCFSFYPTKNLGALGDAGAITTDDAALADHLRALRDHGQSRKYEHALIGYNSRLDGIQAALLRLKLGRLDAWNARRQALAARYRSALDGLPGIELLGTAVGCEHVYHLFVVRCRERERLKTDLQSQGIGTSVHYPLPLHLQPAFAGLGHGRGDFPVAEAAAREVLALPLYPELSDAAAGFVCEAVQTWARQAHA